MQRLGLTSACATYMQPLMLGRGTAGVVTCQALITLVRHGGDPSAGHARFVCSTPPFFAWRRLPLICLKLFLLRSLCVYETVCCFCLRMSQFSATLDFFPRGWRAVTFPRWLRVVQLQSCLTWLIVILIVRSRCCFGGLSACVYETGLLLLFAYVALLLLPLMSLFLGVRVLSLSLGTQNPIKCRANHYHHHGEK